MKKLIAISMMIALVAGAAFAQVEVGAALELRWRLAEEQGTDPKAIGTATSLGASKFSFTTVGDEGNVGARLTFDIKEVFGRDDQGAPDWKRIYNQAYIWWQPIDQIKLQFGMDKDGLFNPTGVTRWGYFRGEPGVVEGGEFWSAENYILGNWDKFSLAITITPMDALTINFGLGLPNVLENEDVGLAQNQAKWEDTFKIIQLQVGYNVDGIGQFWATFQGENAGNKIGLSYHTSSLVEGLDLEVGFAYSLKETEHAFGQYRLGGSSGFNQIGIGLGADYNGGDWGVKTRLFMDGFNKMDIPLWDITPYYDFGFMQFFFTVRITNLMTDAKFIINPYVVKNVGPAQFRAGFSYNTVGSGSWSLNTGMKFSF